MLRTADLHGVAPNRIYWTENFGTERLHGHLRPPYTDNRNLPPPFQVWDLLMNMFDLARQHFHNPSMNYILRMGTGVEGANRYNFNMRGRLRTSPNEEGFFNRIERMIDSNDALDIRDIHLSLDFLE